MPSWVGFGTAAAVSTQVQAAFPASGITAGCKLYYLIGTNSSITTAPAAPSGWASLGAMVNTGTQKVFGYERDADGTETGNGPLITGLTSGTVGAASIICIGPTTGGNTLATSSYSTGVDSSSNTNFSATGTSQTCSTSDLLIGFDNAIAATSFTSGATATLAQAGATLSQTSRFAGRTGSNTVNYNCNTASVTTGGTGAPSMSMTLQSAGTGSALFLRVTESAPTAKSGTDSATVTDTVTDVQQNLSGTETATVTDAPGSVLGDQVVAGTDTQTQADSAGSVAIVGTGTDSDTLSEAISGVITGSSTDSLTHTDQPGSVSGSATPVTGSDAFGFSDSAVQALLPPSFRAAVDSQGTSTTTSFTITIPGTVQQDDFGLIIAAAGSGSNASDPPSGWATIKSDVQIGSGRYAIYGKQYQSGDANPVLNYPTAPATGNNISYLAVWWKDCGGVDIVGSNLTNPAAQFTNTVTGLTSSRDRDLFVAIGWQKGSGTGYPSAAPSVSPDVTVRASRIATGNFYSSLAVADFVVDPAGTVGDQTFTWNFSTANGAGFGLLLKNAEVAPPVSKSGSDAWTLAEAQTGLQSLAGTDSLTQSDSATAPIPGEFPEASDSATQSDSTPSFFGITVSANDQVGFADVATPPGPPAGGDPFIRATAKAAGASTVTSLTAVRPGNVVPGDWGFILADAGNGSGATATPAGWEVVIASIQISGQRIAMYAKQYVAGDNVNTVISWPSAPASGNNTGILAVWVASCEGYDVVGALTNNVTASDITTSAGVTTAEANSLILAFSAIKGSSTGFPGAVSWSPDAVVADSLLATSAFNVGLSVASFIQVAQGLSPDQFADWDFSTTSATGFQISIDPIGGTGTKAAVETFSFIEDGQVSGSNVITSSDTLDVDDRTVSRFIVDTSPDLTFQENSAVYTYTGTGSDSSTMTDISQQTTLVTANDSSTFTDQPGSLGGSVQFFTSSDGSTHTEAIAVSIVGSRPDNWNLSDNSATSFTITVVANDLATQAETPVAIFIPRAAFDGIVTTDISFKFIVGNSNFTLWNGTVELPLDLLGQWDGVTLQPILFEDTV